MGEGAAYEWEINDFNGTPGTKANGWDIVNISKTLTMASSANDPFVVQVVSLTSGTNQSGTAANFDPRNSYSCNIITTGEGITDFSTDKVQIDRSRFANPLAGGKLAISQQGNNLALTFAPVTAFANQFGWADSSGGSFQTPNKWINNAVPGINDTAIFDLSNQNGYTVQLAAATTSKGLVVRNDNLTIDLNNQTYSIIDTSSSFGGVLTVGESFSETANLTITGGTLSTGNVELGEGTGSIGRIVVQGASTSLSSSWIIVIGDSGEGKIEVKNKGTVSGNHCSLGTSNGGIGEAVVTGEGSTFIMTDYVDIARFGGRGTFTVADGGYALGDRCIIGPQGHLTVMDAGSKWNTTTYVEVNGGIDGQGSLTIASGGEVVAGTWLAIGYTNTGSGSVEVSGANSTLKVLSSGLTVGRYGNGTLSVNDGGQIQSARGAIAGFSGSVGQATIKDAGSLWAVSNDLYIGKRWDSPSGGTGSLVVRDGGMVTVGSLLNIDLQGTLDVRENGCLIVGSGTSSRLDKTVHVTLDGTLISKGTITEMSSLTTTACFWFPTADILS